MTEYDKFQAPGSRGKEKFESGQNGESEMLRDKIRGGAEDVKERLHQGFDQTREQGRKAVENIERQAADKPLPTLLIAFGAGFLLGTMVSRGFGRDRIL